MEISSSFMIRDCTGTGLGDACGHDCRHGSRQGSAAPPQCRGASGQQACAAAEQSSGEAPKIYTSYQENEPKMKNKHSKGMNASRICPKELTCLLSVSERQAV